MDDSESRDIAFLIQRLSTAG